MYSGKPEGEFLLIKIATESNTNQRDTEEIHLRNISKCHLRLDSVLSVSFLAAVYHVHAAWKCR